MRRGAAAVIMCLLAAAPALAANDGADLRAKLKAFDKLKKREATLQIVVRRASAAQGEKYRIEYENLKPKLYAAAEAMQHAVQQFEQRHGRAALCAEIPGEYKKHVPACGQ